MTVLPQLKRDLFEAAQATLRPEHAPARIGAARSTVRRSLPRRVPRPSLGGLVATLSVVVSFAIAAAALTLLDHPQATPIGAGHGSSSEVVRRNPLVKQLVDHFAILRRAQTAADRSWAAGQRSKPKSPVQVIPGLTRLAQTVDGKRIFLTIDRLQLAHRRSQRAHHTYSLTVSLVTAHNVFDAPFNPDVGDYTIIPVPLGPISLSGPTTLVSIVPDGIEKVRWVFRCRPAHLAPCHGRQTEIDYPRLRGNIAAAPANSLSPVPAVTWYGPRGKTVVAYNQHEPGKQHPKPFPGIRP